MKRARNTDNRYYYMSSAPWLGPLLGLCLLAAGLYYFGPSIIAMLR